MDATVTRLAMESDHIWSNFSLLSPIWIVLREVTLISWKDVSLLCLSNHLLFPSPVLLLFFSFLTYVFDYLSEINRPLETPVLNICRGWLSTIVMVDHFSIIVFIIIVNVSLQLLVAVVDETAHFLTLLFHIPWNIHSLHKTTQIFKCSLTFLTFTEAIWDPPSISSRFDLSSRGHCEL